MSEQCYLDEAQAALPNTLKGGHQAEEVERLASARHEAQAALANAVELVFANDASLDADGWCLIAPFGEWPKTRRYLEGRQLKEQDFIQVMDNAAADALLDKENSFFGRLKRALIGIPVFIDHGDLKEVDPKALPNGAAKLKGGVVDQIRKGARGIEAHFSLDNDGAQAVEAGWKFPSALWYVLPNGKRGDATLCRPFKLISVALTKYPNISGVESLSNARTTDHGPRTTDQEKLTTGSGRLTSEKQQTIMSEEYETFRGQVIGALIGRDYKLPNDPTDQQLVHVIANDMADADGDGDDAMAATRRAHRASSRATDKDGHVAAAVLHQKASDAHAGAGNKDHEEMHDHMSAFHLKCAGK